MAIPPNARTIRQPMDPADVVDFAVGITQGAADADPPPVLLDGEEVASFSLTLTAEAVAVGLEIRRDGAYPAPLVVDRVVTFWLGVAPAMQGLTVFSGAGATLGIELTITTTSVPPRIKQRTITVTVANQ